MSDDQKLPEPGSVWRRRDGFRLVTDIFGDDIYWSGFRDVGNIVSPTGWHAWAADAVRVWPVTEKGADE